MAGSQRRPDPLESRAVGSWERPMGTPHGTWRPLRGPPPKGVRSGRSTRCAATLGSSLANPRGQRMMWAVVNALLLNEARAAGAMHSVWHASLLLTPHPSNNKYQEACSVCLWTNMADQVIASKPRSIAKDAKHICLRSWLRQAILCKEARAVKTGGELARTGNGRPATTPASLMIPK